MIISNRCCGVNAQSFYISAFIQTDKHLTYIVGDVSSGIPIEVSLEETHRSLSITPWYCHEFLRRKFSYHVSL